MKIIFLDIDGVLNRHDFLKKRLSTNQGPTHSEKIKINEILSKIPDLYDYHENIDIQVLLDMRSLEESLIQNLNKIIGVTNSKIVISSAWRITNTKELLQAILSSLGFDGDIIGFTTSKPVYDSDGISCRGLQIQEWLDENVVENFVILDDSGDMCHLSNKLVQTDPFVGLTVEDVDDAIRILNS